MCDNISEAAVQERTLKQMSQEEKMSLCDYVIVNDDNTSVIDQVLNLHQILLNKAKQL